MSTIQEEQPPLIDDLNEMEYDEPDYYYKHNNVHNFLPHDSDNVLEEVLSEAPNCRGKVNTMDANNDLMFSKQLTQYNMASVFRYDKVSNTVCDAFDLIPSNIDASLSSAKHYVENVSNNKQFYKNYIAEMEKLLTSLRRMEHKCTELVENVANNEDSYSNILRSVGEMFMLVPDQDEILDNHVTTTTPIFILLDNITWISNVRQRLSKLLSSLGSVPVNSEKDLMYFMKTLDDKDEVDKLIASWLTEHIKRIRSLSTTQQRAIDRLITYGGDIDSVTRTALSILHCPLEDVYYPSQAEATGTNPFATIKPLPMDTKPETTTLLLNPFSSTSNWKNPLDRPMVAGSSVSNLGEMNTNADTTNSFIYDTSYTPMVCSNSSTTPSTVTTSAGSLQIPADMKQDDGRSLRGGSSSARGIIDITSPHKSDTTPDADNALGAMKPLTYKVSSPTTPIMSFAQSPEVNQNITPPVEQPLSFIDTFGHGTSALKQVDDGPDASVIANNNIAYSIPQLNTIPPTPPHDNQQVYVVPPASPLPRSDEWALVSTGYEHPQYHPQDISHTPDRATLYGDADPAEYNFKKTAFEDRTSSLYTPDGEIIGSADGRMATEEYWDPAVVGVDSVKLHHIQDGNGTWYKVTDILSLTVNTQFSSNDLIDMIRSTVGLDFVSTVADTSGRTIPVIKREALAAMLKNDVDTCPTRDMCIASLSQCLHRSINRSDWTSNSKESHDRPSVDFAIRHAKLAVNIDDEVVQRRPSVRIEMAKHNFNVLEYSAGRPLSLFVDFLGKVCNQMLQNFNGQVKGIDRVL